MNYSTSIPLVDLGAQQEEIAYEVEIGMKEVFAQTSFIGGPAVAEFEQAYAEFLGAGHCVGVANGTDALELALRSCGVRPGGKSSCRPTPLLPQPKPFRGLARGRSQWT